MSSNFSIFRICNAKPKILRPIWRIMFQGIMRYCINRFMLWKCRLTCKTGFLQHVRVVSQITLKLNFIKYWWKCSIILNSKTQQAIIFEPKVCCKKKTVHQKYKNMLSLKNPQFLPHHYEIRSKFWASFAMIE